MNFLKTFMKKRDFILIIAVLFASFLLWLALFSSSDLVTVYSDGEIFGRFSLSKNQTIDINGTNTLVIKDGKVFMEGASCPDKLCVKQGSIGEKGGSIICLPNKVIAKVKGDFDNLSR